MILLFIFSLVKINEYPLLFYPNFASSDDRFIYISSLNGIGIFNKYNFTFEKGIIFDKSPLFVFPDPFTGEIYVYFKDGNLFSFYMNSPQFLTQKGFFPNARSFSITPTTIKIEERNRIKIYDKFSMIETQKNENSLIWWGKRSIMSFNDPEISFLSPFFYYNQDGEKIDYKLICKDNDYYYVCTKGEGVFVYSKNFWRKEAELKIGPSVKEVRVISILENGEIIIAGVSKGYENGIVIKKGKTWRRFTKYHFGIDAKFFYSGFSYKNISILGGEGKVVIYKDGRFKTIEIEKWNFLPVSSLNYEQPLIFASNSDGLWVFDIDGFSKEKLIDKNSVLSVEISNHYIYVGEERGLFVIDKSNKKIFKVIDKKLYLDAKIKDIKKDDSNNFWVLTGKGLVMIKEKDKNFEFFYPVPSLFHPISLVDGSMFIQGKEIFIGTYKNGFIIYDIENDRWDHFTGDESILKRTVYTFNAKGDTLFVGTDNGIYEYKLK